MKNPHYSLPALNYNFIKDKEYFLLFETSLFDKENFLSYIFFEPVDIIRANCSDNIIGYFEKIERYAERYYLAGYFSYELGYYFEDFKFRYSSPHPVINLAVFDKAVRFNHKTGRADRDVRGLFARAEAEDSFILRNLRLDFNKQRYVQKINRIKKYIRRGDTYQVNLTGKYRFDFRGSAFSFYRDLKKRQNVPYGAFCKFKNEYVISLSPELFFRREGNRIYSRPMKGTLARGKNTGDDRMMFMRLENSIKDKAENIMIVDLIRNDLGRISRTGSVKVSRLFNIEKYDTLFQMTSTVQGRLRKDINYYDIFRSIFPGGSVTGTPKIRTMQIIKELESYPRHIYCGALGMIFPGKRAAFNLPIRTVSIISRRGEMGIGSGITIASNPSREYEECLLKARFLTERYKPFRLLETILWAGRFVFLREHLKRLSDSAEYFGFEFGKSELLAGLKALEVKFNTMDKYRIRLLLNADGRVDIEHTPFSDDNREKKCIAISQERTDPRNIFHYHKTTNRDLYDREYARYCKRGYFDVIFVNIRGEVTEGATSNVIIQKRNRYCTPAVSSGLLPGIFRNYLLSKGVVQEKIVTLDELYKADKIFLCNSVRGLNEVKLSKN